MLTGAGVSTESGVPDFRSASGMWAEFDPREYATLGAFRADPEKVWRFYAPRFAMLTEVEPNPAHVALAELERRGLVRAVVTQNIDLLHERAGSRDVVEVHGSIRTSSCPGCGAVYPLAEVVPLIEAHGAPPCPACGAILKPDVIFFDEQLPEGAMERADRARGARGAAAGRRLLARGLPRRRPAALDARRRGQGRGRQPHADLGGRPRRARPAGERRRDPGGGRVRPLNRTGVPG